MKRILGIIAVLCAAPLSVFAHVGYVLEPKELFDNAGSDWGYFVSPLAGMGNILLMIATGLVVLGLYFAIRKTRFLKRLLKGIAEHGRSYTDLFGWMARLAVGIALIGAGTDHVFISPVLSIGNGIAFFEILLGFLLLAGIFTGLAALGAVLLYCMALFTSNYIFGNLDFLALTLVILALADARPGLDHLLGFPVVPNLQRWRPYVPYFASWGVGIAMTYLALYEKILNPHWSALVVSHYQLTAVVPVSPAMWVFGAGIIELLVGLALIIGFKPRLVSAIAFIILSLSFFYFKESVYSHITLFAALSIIFVTDGKRLPA